MTKLLSMILIITGATAYAIVPTMDTYIMGQDTATAGAYAAQVPTYLSQMTSAMNAVNQVQGLKGLAAVQGAGTQICNLCNANDLASMQNYVNQVNGDLCSQFSQALTNITGSQNAITSLQGVMAAFMTNPKSAGLALQQASIATQTATQNTLAQMQMLQAQVQQKALADEKIAKTQQSTMQTSMATGGW